MANISLQSSIRSCKVDTGWAPRIESDRFENPMMMMCPVWSGYDNAGRRVCPDSYYTKRAGCNSSEDRIVVENALRPQYMEYITLDAQGLQGPIYGANADRDDADARQELDQVDNYSGNFGLQWRAQRYPTCTNYPMSQAMAEEAMDMRAQQQLQEGYISHEKRIASGF